MTKPSRRASNGRLARSGSSLKLVASARIALKPPTPMRQIGASAPPATMMSWRPSRISITHSPMACAPEAQALVVA